MAKIYLSLIRKGLKTIEDVPEQLREEVRSLLEAENVPEPEIQEQEHPDIIVPDEFDSKFAVDDENADSGIDEAPPETTDDTLDTEGEE